jgi:hypothetical protein
VSLSEMYRYHNLLYQFISSCRSSRKSRTKNNFQLLRHVITDHGHPEVLVDIPLNFSFLTILFEVDGSEVPCGCDQSI